MLQYELTYQVADDRFVKVTVLDASGINDAINKAYKQVSLIPKYELVKVELISRRDWDKE